ncbi:MAG: hypothetical protein IT442_14480 [Phycisphaeraceae bacterium]|nr:hypothetical protein [Phycisphaeraceae bacterium]
MTTKNAPSTLSASSNNAAPKDWSHYGHFDDARNEFVITTPDTPLPWDNYLFNDRYLSVSDHLGRGWSKLHTREGYVTFLWNLTAMFERDDNRYVYLRDDESGDYWSVSTFPRKGATDFKCRVGLGYSEISSIKDGIRGSIYITVPMGSDPVELWQVTVKNESDRPRKVSAFTYGRVSLRGAATHGYIHFCQATFRQDINGLFFQNNAPALPHPRYKAFQSADFTPDSWSASKNGFMGQYSNLERPVAVQEGQCPNAQASREAMASCFHKRITLAPGESKTLSFLAGIVANPDEAAGYIEKYLNGDGPRKVIEGVAADAAIRLSSPRIETPSQNINRLINVWTKQQVALGAGWGRWGWRGYRDIIQQTHGANYWDHARVKSNLSEAMTWQMRDGFCVRGWAPFSPKRYADSALWLCYTANDYVKETGDKDYVLRQLPYRDGGVGPVWEHLLKGCEKAFTDVGPHGIPKIHQGDWNDSLSMVGEKGIGESVWIGQALCWALLELIDLFEGTGLQAQAKTARKWHTEMAKRINKVAWDGDWYVRCFKDDKSPLGTHTAKEGRCFINSQSWALIGEVATPERAPKVRQALENELRVKYGYLTLAPAYTTWDPSIGRLTGMPPGTGENAAVYVHANAFVYAAMLKIKAADQALELIETIHPCNKVNPTSVSGATPYVLPNSYYGPGYIKPGRIEGQWVTGSAGWFLHQTVENLCGVHRTHQGLRIDPCLPTTWNGVKVTRNFRGSWYDVDIKRDKSVKGVVVKLDGKQIDGNLLPIDTSGAKHKVEVKVGG